MKIFRILNRRDARRLTKGDGAGTKNAPENYKRRGFTLVELIIALVLMSFITIIAVATMNLSAEGYLGTSVQTSLVREDAAFASRLNKMIKESTAIFTIPEKSFIEEKLTANWNYLGIMNDVKIPASVSRTGEEFTAKNALVYIEYIGTTEPAEEDIPSDCNVIPNADGYFYQKILGYSFTDHKGREYTYSLEFKRTSDETSATQDANYELKLEITDKDGKTVSDDSWVGINNTLKALNATQVIYQGSDDNPARAIAFRPDYMPVYAEMAPTKMTVVMILDTSSSMGCTFKGEGADNLADSKIASLKKQATAYVDLMAAQGDVNVVLVPFENYAGRTIMQDSMMKAFEANPMPEAPDYHDIDAIEEYERLYAPLRESIVAESYKNAKWDYNLSSDEEKDEVIRQINNFSAIYETNMGDAFRVAARELGKMKSNGDDLGKVFLVIMSDGAVNAVNKDANAQIYGIPDTKITTTGAAETFAKKWLDELIKYKPGSAWLLRLGDSVDQFSDHLNAKGIKTESIGVDSDMALGKAFEKIAFDISESMWAFEGPRI